MPGVTLEERMREDTQGGKELDWPTEQMMGLCDDVVRCEEQFLKARFASYGSLFYKEDVSPELRDKPLYHVSTMSLCTGSTLKLYRYNIINRKNQR